jgi:hypothetical protein
MKYPVAARLFQAGGRVTKLIVALRNYANVAKVIYKSWQVVMAYFKVPFEQSSE